MQEFKGFRVELYPTNEQVQQLIEHCNSSVYAHNWAWSTYTDYYKETGMVLSPNKLCQLFTRFKNDKSQPKYEWLHSFGTEHLRISVRNLAKDFNKTFKMRRAGKKIGGKLPNFPKLIRKKDRHRHPFFFTRKDRIIIYDDRISFQDFTDRDNNSIKMKKHNIPIGRNYEYCDPHISCDKCGRWWFSCQLKFKNPIKLNKAEHQSEAIGIDLGIKNFVTLSDGRTFNYPTKKLKRLIKRRTKLANKFRKRCINLKKQTKAKSEYDVPISKNMHKLNLKRQKLDNKIKNIRKNTRYKIANILIKENPKAIVMEGLNVTNMMHHKGIHKDVHYSGFYDMKCILKYKCDWYDIDFIEADPFFPSSKKCSKCGNIKNNLKLNDRVYVCDACGAVIDRDVNAAINLKKLAY